MPTCHDYVHDAADAGHPRTCIGLLEDFFEDDKCCGDNGEEKYRNFCSSELTDLGRFRRDLDGCRALAREMDDLNH